MVIYRPTYATRRQVKTALDVKLSADYDAHVDSALQKAGDDIDGLCKRRFYNVLDTVYKNWPNFERAYPWRVWLNAHEVADITTTAPVVTSGGNTIPANQIFWGPWETDAPPYTFFELDRSTSASFGQGSTPQKDIGITAWIGYWDKTRTAGSLAAAVTDTTSTAITVSDSSLADVGDVLTAGTEAMLVTDTGMASTGQTQSGAGCSTASEADNLLTVASGAALHVGETLQLDGERMYAESITGNIVTVVRAYDGSTLATHSGATVYALRGLTVTRGDFGTTAATHLLNAALTAAVAPAGVVELAIAEALNTVLQKTTGYARSIGENMKTIPGGSLPDLRASVYQKYGRKHRQRVI
jgi:hypothetical protein